MQLVVSIGGNAPLVVSIQVEAIIPAGHMVALCVQTDCFALGPWENEITSRIFFHFLIYFLFELNQLLFNFFIHMPLIVQEVVRIILFLFIRIVYVLAFLSYVINGALDHA